jgi:hypothetical protein
MIASITGPPASKHGSFLSRRGRLVNTLSPTKGSSGAAVRRRRIGNGIYIIEQHRQFASAGWLSLPAGTKQNDRTGASDLQN